MGAANQLVDTYVAKETKANRIADPGNGNAINVTFDDGVCLLSIAAVGETRSLESAASVPIGVHVTVVADTITNSGTCILHGVTFSVAGQTVVFTVTSVSGVNTWIASPSVSVQLFPLSTDGWKIWDALQTNLGATALSADDLILSTGTFGTNAPKLIGTDAGGAQILQRARRQWPIPGQYVPGGSLSLKMTAGMQVITDDTSALDAVVYRVAAPTVDLSAGPAISINSVTLAEKTFTLTATNAVPGDLLDIRIETAVSDVGDAAPNMNSIISEVHLEALCYL